MAGKLENVTSPIATPPHFQLTLRKPWLGWFPKPTVVVNGVAQPAQWGTRNWKVPGEGAATVTIFLFNRMWKFGEVRFEAVPGTTEALLYSAPWLPFGPGKIRTMVP
ncbi:hypothetical protein [Arthrobacter alpinus]|uniref:hypothetical protein n=2 Tax=Arthrobacter TaxID=1663 RepID=UPI000780FA5A|nr:hypothetical protein [Arthrobacter alpinus]